MKFGSLGVSGRAKTQNTSLPIPVQCLFYHITSICHDNHRVLFALSKDVDFDDFKLLIWQNRCNVMWKDHRWHLFTFSSGCYTYYVDFFGIKIFDRLGKLIFLKCSKQSCCHVRKGYTHSSLSFSGGSSVLMSS